MLPASQRQNLARALLHPLWLGSLGVLALNDHVLKGSGLLPGIVTGKLSDFAGLMVAPLLLAVLLRIRARWAFWTAHVAVGAVFSAIQISGDAAQGWSQLMGLFGMPWVITSDPWDLVALPMLLVSATVYPRVTTQGAARLARRSAELAAATGGLACCVATSPPPTEPVFAGFEADLYVHNPNEFEIVVRVRPLAPEVDLECFEVERDPGRLLTEPLFGSASSWTLAPGANMLLADEELGRSSTPPDPTDPTECTAFLVDAENLPPLVVFLGDGAPTWKWVEGTGLSAPDYLAIDYDEDGRASYETDTEVVHELRTEFIEPAPQCSAPLDAQRIAWSDAVPQGTWFLGDIDPGPDGCVQMDLRTGYEQQQALTGQAWTLCLPTGAWPFVPGDRIAITQVGSVDGSGIAQGVHIEALDADVDLPRTGGASLLVSTGEVAAMPADMQLSFVPDFECGLQTEPTCGTIYRPGSVLVSGDFGTLEVDMANKTAESIDTQSRKVELHLIAAQERAALHAECVQGSTLLGIDIELAAVRHRAE